MKLLFDENLAPRLVSDLSDLYPDSIHAHACDLGGASDAVLWEYAKLNGYAIVSKDSDFFERSVLDKDSPKVIWIRLGNCSTGEIERLLRLTHDVVRRFVETDRETCLQLQRIQ